MNGQRMGINAKIDAVHEGYKAAPALAGAGYSVAGMPWSDIAAIVTILYVLLQIGLLVPKYWELFKQWRTSKSDSQPPAPPHS